MVHAIGRIDSPLYQSGDAALARLNTMNRAITHVLVINVTLTMTAAIRVIAFSNLDLVYLVLIAVAVTIGIVFSAIIALQNASLKAPIGA